MRIHVPTVNISSLTTEANVFQYYTPKDEQVLIKHERPNMWQTTPNALTMFKFYKSITKIQIEVETTK